jgi:hypothetical protein
LEAAAVRNRNNRKQSNRKADKPFPQASAAPLLVFDLNELATALRISRWSARRLVELGEIPAISMPAVNQDVRRRDRAQRMRRIIVAVDDVRRWIERNRETN